jgi:hypothetical protein
MATTGRTVVRLCLSAALLAGGQLSMAATASAAPQGASQPTASRPAPSAAPASVDVSKLPLDTSRIQRGLRASTTTEQRDGLNLRYVVTVFGENPRIKLFTPEDNLVFGRAPYGAPTHAELMQQITPQPYRAPAANFGAALGWFSNKAKK